jgi:hypothetical protein
MSTPNPVSADLAEIKAKLAAFETKQVGWFKANWPHLVTWVGGVALAVKHFL